MKRIIALFSLAFLLLFNGCNNNEPLPIAVGDFYQGGIVFYIDDTGQHGLIVTPSNLQFGSSWSCDTRTLILSFPTDTHIGSGKSNTENIVQKLDNICYGDSFAPLKCMNLSLNGHSDWFLPSKDELTILYQNKDLVDEGSTANLGSYLTSGSYWTSSAQDDDSIWVQNFITGDHLIQSKTKGHNVRAIREF